MKKFLLLVALIASPAWGQTQLTPKIKSATARADPCAPIGKTAKGELVYSMKCDNLPAPPAKTQRAAGLTPESAGRQNRVGVDRLSDAEYAAFEQVNNAYRSKCGFPYIVCVRRHTKDSILRDFERRLPSDAKAEMQTSIDEICRIAALRIDQLVASEDRLPVHGRLSTHVLDTHGGRPAAGIWVGLVELSDLGASRVVARAITNSDGRTDQALIHGRPGPIVRY